MAEESLDNESLEKVIINKFGIDYEFWVTPVQKVAFELNKNKEDSYKFKCKSDGVNTQLNMIITKDGKTEIRNIGYLRYNIDTDIITYVKFGFNLNKHLHDIDQSIGLCWNVVENLRPKDYILVYEKGDDSTSYQISVSKFVKNQVFKWYKNQGFEKQVFCPISEFRKNEVCKEKKTKKSKSKSA